MLMAFFSAPAYAESYPVSGKWGQSSSSKNGVIDYSGRRVIAFNGDQRTDSNGGVPIYRNRSVTAEAPSRWRIVDEFTTGQISNAHTSYTLHQIDIDHIELQLQQGGTLKMQRCK
jgi:hypothetical protein